MANLFDQIISQFREVNGGKDDDVIRALLAKKAEMGDHVSDEEVLAIAKAILEAQRAKIEGGSSSGSSRNNEEEITISAADRQYMSTAIAVVRAFLDDNKWRYSEKSRRPDLHSFELGFTVEGCSLRARIYVEADPRVCRIDAILPITADPIYEYPLSLKLAKFNYSKRFGSLKYDHRDGELSYSYSFLSENGINSNDLKRLFHIVLDTASDAYEEIRRCAVGKFNRTDIDDILQKVNSLVSDITD